MPTLAHYSHQAIANLMSAKLRTSLAILGILVGTSAVVALVNCGQLATEKALMQFKQLGTNLISIAVFQQSTTNNNAGHISLAYWRKLAYLVPEIARIAPYNMVYQPVSFQGHPFNPGVRTIIGADEKLQKIIHIHLADGHFVSFTESYERFCVIGHELAQQLKAISVDNPLGKSIQIGRTLYTIIGVAAPWQENGFFTEDINKAIIVPIEGVALLDKNSQINNAIARLKSDKSIDIVIQHINHLLQIQAPDAGLFVRSAKQVIASMESQSQIFTVLLAIIGSISLLVGGIGVMNVMLNTVMERKKEIGIRKAIGAKNSEIQALFLVESVILSLLGGFLGVILGMFVTIIIAYFSEWPFMFNIKSSLAGFGVSFITGIFFGFYPARRASHLEPIQCLRSE